MRTVGVRGKNLPAKRNLSVIASNFLIGGMLIECERRYNKAYAVSNIEEFAKIFGNNIDSTMYGYDVVKGFFDNTVGVDSTLYIQSMLGYNVAGPAIDAVVASREKVDEGADADAYVVKPAYEDELQYGEPGNRIGTKFTRADRFATKASATCPATGQSYAELDSVIGVRVGDLILFATASGASPVYKIITQVDESLKRVYWTGDFEVSGGSAESLAIDDDVTIPGFKVQVYYKDINGVEIEVDTELGKVICSSESAVTEYFVENVFKTSTFIQVTVNSASTLGERLPVADSAVVYPTTGADGTTVVTVTAQAYFLSKLDTKPIRFLANPETTDESMQKALISYSLARRDNPLVWVNVAEDRTKSQLITIGQAFQSSAFTPMVLAGNWLKVSDPFSNSSTSPARTVPNVGHLMGLWIRSIGLLGVHFVPATGATLINGVLGIVGDQFLDDNDRTDLADAGVNVIQEKAGIGIKLANCFTGSTDTAYKFGNGILMRNFIKVSSEDSLASSENEPNSLNRIEGDRMAILQFLYKLWQKGSTGDVAIGETFGQGRNEDNSPTVAEDHFQVRSDITINPQASIDLGERTHEVYFTYPTPAVSIEIGVGILLRG
jgi:hypothetical protein